MKKWKVLSHNKKIDSREILIEELFNLRSIENRKKFLEPSVSDLKVEDSGISKNELNKAINRLIFAMEKNQKVVIVGDYDVDGICSSAILWETIYKKYKNIFPYIPDRFTEGYGLSEKSLSNVIKKYPDVKLLITVDNGIVANTAIDFANSNGIDVIVTDHHVPGDVLPDAKAIVHTTSLCGAGVAWILAREIKDKILEKEYESFEHLELVALATVADLVPLLGLNRIFVKLGLNHLHNSKRIGLLALLKTARIEKEKIGTYHIGYMIGPRLNATGRISHAMESLRLLCTNDQEYASMTAQILEETNKMRQEMVLKSSEHAKLSVVAQKELGNIVMVHHESYQEGIVGLIASRLVERYCRPSIAISVGEVMSKGSARSINGINIIELLRSVSGILNQAGGHPMAAGFSIQTKKIDDFYEALKKGSSSFDKKLFEKELRVDMEIGFSLIDESLYNDIQQLSPFGMGNPEPVFMSRGITILDRRNLGKDGSHLKLKLSKDDKIFDAIGFGMANEIDAQIGDVVDTAYIVDINEWKERKNIQLKIRDIILQ